MARFPVQYVNINGIQTIQARSINVTTSAVNFTFNPDWDRNPFRGLLLVKLAEELPTGTTTTLPITFTMAGRTSTVTLPGGDEWTAANYGVGIYLLYYDRFTDDLQLLSIYPEA